MILQSEELRGLDLADVQKDASEVQEDGVSGFHGTFQGTGKLEDLTITRYTDFHYQPITEIRLHLEIDDPGHILFP